MRADAGWTNPLLGNEAIEQLKNAYGKATEGIIDILESSPYEIVVLARLLAYLKNIMEG